MIELFDPARLERRRDPWMIGSGVVLVLAVVGMGVWAVTLQARLQDLKAQTRELEARLKREAERPAGLPAQALLADLAARAQKLEAEVAAAGGPVEGAVVISPVQWMDRLSALGSREVSLQKIEIDRSGSVRLEGLAASPAALSALVQAWERQEQFATLPPRSFEVKQERAESGAGAAGAQVGGAQAASHLRFQLRAAARGATVAGGRR